MKRKATTEKRTLTREEWLAEGTKLFGPDEMEWRFKCPACGFVATPTSWKRCRAPMTAVAYSCVGRWDGAVRTAFGEGADGPGPCNYAGGGLFTLNPVGVVDGGKTTYVFEFAPKEVSVAEDGSNATAAAGVRPRRRRVQRR